MQGIYGQPIGYPNVSQPYGYQMGYGAPQNAQVNGAMRQGFTPNPMQNPGNFNPMGGVIPSAAGAVPQAVPGFIPLAQPPTMDYIPPPPKPLPFTLVPRNQAVYANIYSILQTVQILQDEAINGNIDLKIANEKTEKLKKPFKVSVDTAKFSPSDVRAFAEACDLDCSIALDVLLPAEVEKPKAKKAISQKDFMEFGQSYTSINDCILLKVYSKIRTPFTQFRLLFDRICPDDKKYYKDKTRKWGEFFQDKELDEKTVTQFKNDIDLLFNALQY